MNVDVQGVRTVDGPELAASLGGDYRNGHLLVEAADATAVTHAIEAWMAERGLPLVPVRLDEHTLALVPPAA